MLRPASAGKYSWSPYLASIPNASGFACVRGRHICICMPRVAVVPPLGLIRTLIEVGALLLDGFPTEARTLDDAALCPAVLDATVFQRLDLNVLSMPSHRRPGNFER